MMRFVTVEGRRNGAPPEACILIQPQHSTNSQNSPVPFSVDLSAFTGNTYTPGETYTSKRHQSFGLLFMYQYLVTLRGSAANPSFIGFMIQAWLVADNSAVGKFDASGIDYQAQCQDDVRLYTQTCCFIN